MAVEERMNPLPAWKLTGMETGNMSAILKAGPATNLAQERMMMLCQVLVSPLSPHGGDMS